MVGAGHIAVPESLPRYIDESVDQTLALHFLHYATLVVVPKKVHVCCNGYRTHLSALPSVS